MLVEVNRKFEAMQQIQTKTRIISEYVEVFYFNKWTAQTTE